MDIFDLYCIRQAVAASIEAIYILLGEPDLHKRQDPISFNKLEDMPVSFSSCILRQIVNIRRMDVETQPEFIADTIQLLTKSFSLHRKVFLLQDIESITKKLGHIASTPTWLRFLLPDLYAEIAWCLKLHNDHLFLSSKNCTKTQQPRATTEHLPSQRRQRRSTYYEINTSSPKTSPNL